MDGEKKMERNIGYSRIVGEVIGEKMEDLGKSEYSCYIMNRMRRGVDDSAIESMAEAAVPIVIRNGGSSLFV